MLLSVHSHPRQSNDFDPLWPWYTRLCFCSRWRLLLTPFLRWLLQRQTRMLPANAQRRCSREWMQDHYPLKNWNCQVPIPVLFRFVAEKIRENGPLFYYLTTVTLNLILFDLRHDIYPYLSSCCSRSFILLLSHSFSHKVALI